MLKTSERTSRIRARLAASVVVATLLLEPGAMAAAQAQQIGAAMRQACRADVASLCGDVQPGGGRIIACLRKNASGLSSDCKQAIAAAKSGQ